MAVVMRLQRHGTKKKPFYWIVALDSRTPRDGRFLENLGTYDPRTEPPAIEVKEDRALYWLGQGAKPSGTVRSLLRKQGALKSFFESKKKTAKAKSE